VHKSGALLLEASDGDHLDEQLRLCDAIGPSRACDLLGESGAPGAPALEGVTDCVLNYCCHNAKGTAKPCDTAAAFQILAWMQSQNKELSESGFHWGIAIRSCGFKDGEAFMLKWGDT
jgi:hypothetical protein